ncbi:STAS domain-containing protein [Paractinoplanes hotanensis]|uniref:Anti-sigma factor antagonist n=1 Tax=Paractinoplanes hotanensis TaxID=2906497 RepID=A0ABT0YGI1_9ACTN|nr:STAS domain-containing protein [Actinoplanes hotanensis]MCM4084349.1 STAS domain-containing protein [Actinoplanes hotanensis]
MSVTPSPAPSLPLLRIESSRLSEGAVRVAVAGEIDLATVDELEDALLGIPLAEPLPAIEVDLGEVTFLDCCGVSALVAGRNAAVRAGGGLRITRPQPAVRRVLELTGLLGVLTSDPIGPRVARPFPGTVRPVNVSLVTNSPAGRAGANSPDRTAAPAPARSGLVTLPGRPAPGEDEDEPTGAEAKRLGGGRRNGFRADGPLSPRRVTRHR